MGSAGTTVDGAKHGAATAWSDGPEKMRSLNATEAPRSLANPFENTPHGEVVANYLDESRRLQTLHLSGDAKGANRALQEIRSVGAVPTHHALGSKFSGLYDSVKAGEDSRSRELPATSRGSAERRDGDLSSLRIPGRATGPPGSGAKRAEQIKIHGLPGSALDEEIQLAPAARRPGRLDLHGPRAGASRSGLNTGKELDYSFQPRAGVGAS
jgi:hypothetical protein